MTIVQNYFISNGVAKPIADFTDNLINGNTTIYEVIKVINSKPVFLEEHIKRMQNSIQKAGIDYSANTLVSNSIYQLLEINPVERNNIRVALVFDEAKQPKSAVVYFIPSKYPTPTDYLEGVCISTIKAERDNPTAKIENKSLRNRANEIIEANKLFEVLLVNHEGRITEGSRSNIFFIKDGSIITAPDEVVLGGITRDKVLSICQNNGFRVEMRCLHVDELQNIDAMFITGTSPCVLPIKECNNKPYNAQHNYISTILKQYLAEEQK